MKIDLQEQFDRALALLNLPSPTTEDLDTAEGIFNALLNIDMQAPQLLYCIASVHIRRKHFALGMHLLKLVLQIDPENFYAWNNLGFVYREQHLLDDAKAAFTKALEYKKDDPDFYMNLGGMHVAEGTPDIAIEYADKALAIDANHRQARWNKSLALLEKGDYANGFALYADSGREEDARKRNIKYGYDVPYWQGEEGKTLHVSGEQGIGDEIMFSSMIPELLNMNCKVILEAHPRLYKLFRQSFKHHNIVVYGTRKDNEVAWPLYNKVDAKIEIGSLGKFFRKSKDDFSGMPYMMANDAIVEKYHAKLSALSDKPKIGISWIGGTKKTNRDARTIPLKTWLPIFEAIDAEFISLQYTDNAQKEIDEFCIEHPKYRIHHWQDAIDNYEETAALVSNLDLVISVPQSVVHLAGALGTYTYQLTPKNAMWQMGVYGDDMPWYASVKNIWQDENKSWEPVIAKMAKELKNICSIYQKNIAA